MRQDEPVRVQGQSARQGAGRSRGVQAVAENRAPDRFHVNPDLVKSAGQRAALDEARSAAGRKHPVRRDRGFSGSGYLRQFHCRGARGRAALGPGLHFGDRAAHNARNSARNSLNDRPVVLADPPGLEGATQVVVRAGPERDHEQTAGFAVEPVQQSEIAGAPEALQRGAVPRIEPVEERIMFVTDARLGDHSRGFHHNGQIAVTVKGGELHMWVRVNRRCAHAEAPL